MSDPGKIFQQVGKIFDELANGPRAPKPKHSVALDKEHGLMIIKYENWPEDLEKTKVQVEAMLDMIFQKIEKDE